jgi:cytosine permease
MFGYMLAQHLGWLSVVAFVFLFCNLGSVCAHCLYNASVGWSRIGNGRMRVFAVGLAVVGITIAAANVWALFIPWLSLLGILVPPIGAIILADLYFIRPGAQIHANWRPRAFVAWFIGSLVAYGVETYMPSLSTAISAFIAGGVGYFLLSKTAAAASEAQATATA